MANDGPLADVLDEMDRVVTRDRSASDRNGYFAALYRGVTREVDRQCRTAAFDDGERMAAFARAFARRYLDAVGARHGGAGVPRAWAGAFEQGNRWRPIVLQHLMLGMNAHINLDLGVVTAEFADRHGLAAMAADFDRINQVLGTMVESCQRLVGEASPWLGALDRVGGRTDSGVVRFSLVRARTAAWHTAERLSRLAPEERLGAVAELDREVAGLARLVLDAPGWAAPALFAIRARETRSVRRTIDLLATAAPATA